MLLPPELIRSVPFPMFHELSFSCSPIQVGLRGSPWHVAVASILMQRVKRDRGIIECVFRNWSTPELMCIAEDLDLFIEPLGLHRTRARFIRNLSLKWNLDVWSDFHELTGVGKYVAAAVELFCFNYPGNATVDRVLSDYSLKRPAFPMLWEDEGKWYVDGDELGSPVEAYHEYSRKLTVPA